MKELSKLQSLAQLDGLIQVGANPELFICDREVLKYLHSYDAIIPLIKKWVESFLGHNEQVNASTRFNYALTDTLNAANSHAAEQYGWTYVQTILSTPEQLSDALLRVTGKWVE